VPTLQTRDLAIYGSIIATLNGLWALFHAVVRDRARIFVRPYYGEILSPGGGGTQSVFMVSVSNRGRRAASIGHVAYVTTSIRGTRGLSMDIMRQLTEPKRLDEGEAFTVVHGQAGGYVRGDLPTKRWFVQDGAGRIHPLRERYRQRAESFLFWPLRRFHQNSSA